MNLRATVWNSCLRYYVFSHIRNIFYAFKFTLYMYAYNCNFSYLLFMFIVNGCTILEIVHVFWKNDVILPRVNPFIQTEHAFYHHSFQLIFFLLCSFQLFFKLAKILKKCSEKLSVKSVPYFSSLINFWIFYRMPN